MAKRAVATLKKKEEDSFFETLYRELGYHISHLEEYERALKYFDFAISKAPDDRRALMGRAWARSKASQYEGALNDIRTALDLDPDDIEMLHYKALNTYLNCEFEDGMVQNRRQLLRRKKPDYFRMGAMHCADAIENCLAERAGRPLRDHYLIIRKLAWKKNFELQKSLTVKPKNKKKPRKKNREDRKLTAVSSIIPAGARRIPTVSSSGVKITLSNANSTLGLINSIYSQTSEQNVDPPPIMFPYKPLQKYTTNIENYMAEKYLHTLYKDKLFLKALPFEPGVECPNEAGTAKILHLANLGYKSIKYKQELLRARRPFYFIKYQEATSTGALKDRQEQQLNCLRLAAKKEGDLIVHKMKEALRAGNGRLVMELAEKLINYCNHKPRKILPARNEYLNFLYEAVCQAQFATKHIDPSQMPWDQERKIYKLLGIHTSREPSTDSIGGQYKKVFVDWKKQILIYNDRLRKATNSKELCWLFHELCRFHTELKQYELGHVYARKCMNEAKRIHKHKWIINALVLKMRINIAQRSKNDAKTDALEAMEIANEMGDDDLYAFLTLCRDVIEKVTFDEKFGPKILMEREQKILEMMAGDKIKDEAAHLFRMMSAMPAARRMSVMPGIKITDDEDDKKRLPLKKQSILPGLKRSSDFEAQSGGSKRGNQPDDSKGKVFIKMIEDHLDEN